MRAWIRLARSGPWLVLAGLVAGCPLDDGACRVDADCPARAPAAPCQGTAGTCQAGQCTYPLRAAGPCDDGNGCTYDDTCDVSGQCRGLPIDCAVAPAAVCESAEILRVARAPGACVDGACRFVDEPITCAHGCQAGACRDDPCQDVVCDTPPVDRCLGPWALESHDPVGVCDDGACRYPPVRVPCAAGCLAGACQDGRGPRVAHFEVSPTRVHFTAPWTRVGWRAPGARALRLEVVEDGRVLCDSAQGCTVDGTPDDGSVVVEVPFVHTTLRLALVGAHGVAFAEAVVELQAPRFPELRFNDLGVWLLTHQPLRLPYRFVVLNDIQYAQGECPRPEHAARIELKQQVLELDPPPLFVLGVGDMLVNGKPCEYEQFIDDTLRPFYEEHGIPWLMVGGNHDLYDAEAPATYRALIGEHALVLDLGRLRLVGSNNYVDEPAPSFGFGDALATWLEATLVEAEQLGRSAVLHAVHYPPRLPTDVGACGTNLLHPYDRHFFDGRRGYPGADRFVQLFSAHAPLAALSLSGHAHVYANYVRDGVRFVVSGGGDGVCPVAFDEGEVPDAPRPLHDGAFNHFVLFTVLDDVELRYRGQVLRRGSDHQPASHYDFDQDTDEVLQAARPLPFVERFDDPRERLEVWDYYTSYRDALSPVGFSRWRRDAGALRHDGELRHGERASCWPACHGSLARTWTRTWGDVRARVTVRGSDQPIVGLVARYQDDDHYYRLALDRLAGALVLTRHAVEIEELGRATVPAPAASALLSLEAREQGDATHLVGVLDGTAVLELDDTASTRPRFGGVGLTTFGGGAVWFDDVEVVAATP